MDDELEARLARLEKYEWEVVAQRELAVQKTQAENVVKVAMGGAGAVGFIPIPGADAPLIIAAQSAMLLKIFAVYRLENLGKQIIATSLTGIVMTNIGRSVAGNFLKMIPGVGTVVGGLICGGVAASLTGLLGEASIRFCEYAAQASARGEDMSVIHDNSGEIFKAIVEAQKTKK